MTSKSKQAAPAGRSGLLAWGAVVLVAAATLTFALTRESSNADYDPVLSAVEWTCGVGSTDDVVKQTFETVFKGTPQEGTFWTLTNKDGSQMTQSKTFNQARGYALWNTANYDS